MRVLKIVAGFVTNSSSTNAPLVVAIKYGLTFTNVIQKLGFDISKPFLREFADELDKKFVSGRRINCSPDRHVPLKRANLGAILSDEEGNEEYEGEAGEELPPKEEEVSPNKKSQKSIPAQYRRGYQVSRISVEVQVYGGGGWVSQVDGFLVDLGWNTTDKMIRHILEDDFAVLAHGKTED